MKHFLIVAVVLFLGLLLAVAGCAKTATSAPTPAAPAPTAEKDGRQLFLDKGCIACHKINGEGGNIGPSLIGISGQIVELTTGEKITRTHEYLHESVIDPSAKVVKGYEAGMMPKTSLTADELHEISEFIESLK